MEQELHVVLLRTLTSILNSGGNPRICGLKRSINIVFSPPKSLTLPTSIQACGHSHCTQLSFLSHQENCGDGKYLGLCCSPEHSFSRNQMLGASDSVPLIIPSQLHADYKPMILTHPDPLLSDPVSLLSEASQTSVISSLPIESVWQPAEIPSRESLGGDGMKKSEFYPLFQRLRYRCGPHNVAPVECMCG